MSRSLVIAALVGGLCFVAGIRFEAWLRVDRATAAETAPDEAIAGAAGPMRTEAVDRVETGRRSFEWRRSGSDLVRPLMGCEPTRTGQLDALRPTVEGIIARAAAAGTATHVGVYVHDLAGGQWFGINPDTYFVPASIGKVPLLISLLRVEEDADGTLGNPVDYPEWLRENDRQSIRPAVTVRAGYTWTLGQLAEAMIVESDNNATFLVRGQLDQVLVDQVYRDLGWSDRRALVDGSEQMTTTPRAIGGTFEALYNATYLGEGTSDLALRMLTRVRMRDGLVAGVPPDVTVAHKFGEWWTGASNATAGAAGGAQFHDCGIVYRPRRPYVACVMTRGANEAQRPLIELVAEISRALWMGFEGLPPAG